MQRRRVAMAVAGAAALGAVALVALVLQPSGPSGLMQRIPTYYMPKDVVEMKNPKTGRPVYYLPVHKKAKQAKLAEQKPVVYYYMPKGATMLPGNASAGDSSAAAEPAFVCTTDNIKALSAEVQPKWDECMNNPNYVVPNKDAKRRLLEWVWEPEAGVQKTAAPRHGPSHYEMRMTAATQQHAQHHLEQNLRSGAHRMSAKLAASHLVVSSTATMLPGNASGGNASDAGAAPATPSMDECKAAATKDACEKLSSCGDPVCSSYYKEPEIEALCGMCLMSAGGFNLFGCFADEGVVEVAGKGPVSVASLQVGDEVRSADGHSRVYFTHSHKEASETVRLTAGDREMELTSVHVVPVYTEECGASYCAAAKNVQAQAVKVGDVMYTSEGMATVTAMSKGVSKVTYVLTESDTIIVDGVVATTYSTGAKSLETLPFRAVDYFARGALQWGPIAAALNIILESPLLQSAEALVNAVAFMPSAKLPASAARAGAAPMASF